MREFAIDTDKIICNFILAIVYLFVALEEADYQVLIAAEKNEDEFANSTNFYDSWSLKSLISHQRNNLDE